MIEKENHDWSDLFDQSSPKMTIDQMHPSGLGDERMNWRDVRLG